METCDSIGFISFLSGIVGLFSAVMAASAGEFWQSFVIGVPSSFLVIVSILLAKYVSPVLLRVWAREQSEN